MKKVVRTFLPLLISLCLLSGMLLPVCAGSSVPETPVIPIKPESDHTHDLGDPEYSWSEDFEWVTATCYCKAMDDYTVTETVQTDAVTVPATCTEDGSVTYTAVFLNPVFVTQTKTVVLEAAGHDWGDAVYTWSTDNTTCTAKRECRTVATHRNEESVSVSVTTEEATCTEDGSITYTAAFIDSAFETQTKTVPIPATGHDWGEVTYTWDEDYASATASRSCKNDPSHVESETVTAASEVIKAATTTESGEVIYTATFSNPAFAEQKADVVTNPIPEETVWGDANVDGKITTADIIRLKNYLANYDYVTGESSVQIGPGADANGDEKINTADIIRLKNYLANYDYESGTSTYVLGPVA